MSKFEIEKNYQVVNGGIITIKKRTDKTVLVNGFYSGRVKVIKFNDCEELTFKSDFPGIKYFCFSENEVV